MQRQDPEYLKIEIHKIIILRDVLCVCVCVCVKLGPSQ